MNSIKLILGLILILSLVSCTALNPKKANAVGEKLVNDWLLMNNTQDADLIDRIFTDDCVYEDVPGLEIYHGIDEVKASLIEDFTWCSDFKAEMTYSIITENGAVIEWIWSGRQTGDIEGLIEATGKPFSIRGASVMEFQDGKIKKHKDYYDGGGFLYQLGVKFEFPSGKILEQTE